mmetsp:Transcript_75327/g.226321  ORF Transcript_75327/g.226321 Transcript_75327/m.226321 type:complete len:282 (+) Transcript_75327:276-1121(+)
MAHVLICSSARYMMVRLASCCARLASTSPAIPPSSCSGSHSGRRCASYHIRTSVQMPSRAIGGWAHLAVERLSRALRASWRSDERSSGVETWAAEACGGRSSSWSNRPRPSRCTCCCSSVAPPWLVTCSSAPLITARARPRHESDRTSTFSSCIIDSRNVAMRSCAALAGSASSRLVAPTWLSVRVALRRWSIGSERAAPSWRSRSGATGRSSRSISGSRSMRLMQPRAARDVVLEQRSPLSAELSSLSSAPPPAASVRDALTRVAQRRQSASEAQHAWAA